VEGEAPARHPWPACPRGRVQQHTEGTPLEVGLAEHQSVLKAGALGGGEGGGGGGGGCCPGGPRAGGRTCGLRRWGKGKGGCTGLEASEGGKFPLRMFVQPVVSTCTRGAWSEHMEPGRGMGRFSIQRSAFRVLG